MCAEIAPYCRRETKAMLYRETSANPLLLLQRQQLVRIKHAYSKCRSRRSKSARDVALIAHNESNKRLALLQAANSSSWRG